MALVAIDADHAALPAEETLPLASDGLESKKRVRGTADTRGQSPFNDTETDDEEADEKLLDLAVVEKGDKADGGGSTRVRDEVKTRGGGPGPGAAFFGASQQAHQLALETGTLNVLRAYREGGDVAMNPTCNRSIPTGVAIEVPFVTVEELLALEVLYRRMQTLRIRSVRWEPPYIRFEWRERTTGQTSLIAREEMRVRQLFRKHSELAAAASVATTRTSHRRRRHRHRRASTSIPSTPSAAVQPGLNKRPRSSEEASGTAMAPPSAEAKSALVVHDAAAAGAKHEERGGGTAWFSWTRRAKDALKRVASSVVSGLGARKPIVSTAEGGGADCEGEGGASDDEDVLSIWGESSDEDSATLSGGEYSGDEDDEEGGLDRDEELAERSTMDGLPPDVYKKIVDSFNEMQILVVDHPTFFTLCYRLQRLGSRVDPRNVHLSVKVCRRRLCRFMAHQSCPARGIASILDVPFFPRSFLGSPLAPCVSRPAAAAQPPLTPSSTTAFAVRAAALPAVGTAVSLVPRSVMLSAPQPAVAHGDALSLPPHPPPPSPQPECFCRDIEVTGLRSVNCVALSNLRRWIMRRCKNRFRVAAVFNARCGNEPPALVVHVIPRLCYHFRTTSV